MIDQALFSSDRMDWGTPLDLFARLDMEFCFTVDAAASPANALCRRFFCEDHWYRVFPRWVDGLAQDWTGERVWCNPPYGREIVAWIEKAAQFEAEIAVLLIPSRTDTRYWHNWIWDEYNATPRPGVQTRFSKGRLRFQGAPSVAPFPSVVVVFDRLQRTIDNQALLAKTCATMSRYPFQE